MRQQLKYLFKKIINYTIYKDKNKVSSISIYDYYCQKIISVHFLLVSEILLSIFSNFFTMKSLFIISASCLPCL